MSASLFSLQDLLPSLSASLSYIRYPLFRLLVAIFSYSDIIMHFSKLNSTKKFYFIINIINHKNRRMYELPSYFVKNVCSYLIIDTKQQIFELKFKYKKHWKTFFQSLNNHNHHINLGLLLFIYLFCFRFISAFYYNAEVHDILWS